MALSIERLSPLATVDATPALPGTGSPSSLPLELPSDLQRGSSSSSAKLAEAALARGAHPAGALQFLAARQTPAPSDAEVARQNTALLEKGLAHAVETRLASTFVKGVNDLVKAN